MVGKTSIINRYTKGEFFKSQDRTINSNCVEKILNINNTNFVLNIWVYQNNDQQDTAGEEKYHALAPLFYRDSDGGVLVFDIGKKESFESLEKWILELRSYAGDIKLIIVGNKNDLPPNRIQVSNEEAKALASKYDSVYISASAMEDKNISDIFSTLAIEIYHHKMKKQKDKQRKKSLRIAVQNDTEKKGGCC